MFFQLAEGHRTRLNTKINPKTKACKQRSSEGGAEGVEEDQRVTHDSVEGQNASRTIHIDGNPVGRC